ncbi:PAS domain S-box protein [Magnetospira thiophila]
MLEQEMAQFALEHTALEVYWADQTGRLVEANPAACKALGYTREELLALRVADVDPKTDEAVWARVLNELRVNRKTRIETVHRRKDGSDYEAEVTVSIFEKDGVELICGLAQDISERKKLERDLQDSLDIYKAAINTPAMGFWVLDLTGRLLEVNTAYAKLSGYGPSELIGMRIGDLDVEESAEDTAARIRQISTEGFARFRTRHRRKDGSIWPVEVVTTHSVARQGCFFVFLEDVTEKVELEAIRQKAQQALMESEQNLTHAQKIANMGSWTLDLTTNELTWSDQVFSIFGIDKDRFGATYEAFIKAIHPDDVDEVQSQFRGSVEGKNPYDVVHRIVRNDDKSVRWVREKCEHTRDAEGNVLRSMGTVQDITESKLTEDALRASNENLQTFSHLTSHDLREPLRMITSYLQLIERKCSACQEGDIKDYIGFAVEGAKRMDALIQDLLLFSRIQTQAVARDAVDTLQVVRAVSDNLRLQIESQGGRLLFKDLPVVRADHGHMVQLFQNIISNAFKYQDEATTPRVEVAASVAGGYATFSVTDNGIGMKAEYFDRIFGIFERLHSREAFEGTGIGLAVCKNIVERNGGRIWVESEPGKGSTFYFTLPVAL